MALSVERQGAPGASVVVSDLLAACPEEKMCENLSLMTSYSFLAKASCEPCEESEIKALVALSL